MRKLLALLILLMPTFGFAQDAVDSTVTFRFVAADDIFYIPWSGNGAELERLYALVDEYRTEISAGAMPVQVDGYCASLPTAKENLHTAFVRSNRVKSELITRKGLREADFITANHAGAYDGNKDVVVVTLRIPAPAKAEPVREEPETEKPAPTAAPEPAPAVGTEPAPEKQPEPVAEQQLAPPLAETAPAPQTYSRWSIGANIGLPFFWGDMTSLSADKTYVGISAGIQGGCQISPLLGITFSLDWAQNKAGSRDYAKGYLLDPAGMTWYTPQSFSTQAYGDLYSKINMFSAGLHLDVNVLHLFGPRIANGRFKVIVSPVIYAQHFSSKVYTKSDDKVYAGDRLSKDISLGLGGDVALRYAVSPAFDVQLKGTGIWITDNAFDTIETVGYVRQNAMWGVSAGLVWKIGGNRNTNLLYKSK